MSTATESKSDIADTVRQDICLVFRKAISQYQSENDVAQAIVETIRKKYGGTWHCIVGKSYGSAIAYDEKKHFCELLGQFLVQMWRCG